MSATAVTKPRVSRVKSLHGHQSTDQVGEFLRGRPGNWMFMPRSWIPDLFRISKSLSQAGFLAVVRSYTEGAPTPKGRKLPDYTVPITPEDFAKELGFSEEQMRQAIEEAITRNLVERKCGCKAGEMCRKADHYRFRLLTENWSETPNAFIPRENALKKPVDQEETRPIAIGRMEVGKSLRVPPNPGVWRAELPETAPAKVVEIDTVEGAPDIVTKITDGGLLRISVRGSLAAAKRPVRTSNDLQAIIQALMGYCQPDDDGATALLAACRKVASDCTGDEVAYFVHQKGKRAAKSEKPFGFLLSFVPPCFKGEAFRQTRIKLQEAAKADEQRRSHALTELRNRIAFSRQLIDDPQTPESDRQMAQESYEQDAALLRDLETSQEG